MSIISRLRCILISDDHEVLACTKKINDMDEIYKFFNLALNAIASCEKITLQYYCKKNKQKNYRS